MKKKGSLTVEYAEKVTALKNEAAFRLEEIVLCPFRRKGVGHEDKAFVLCECGIAICCLLFAVLTLSLLYCLNEIAVPAPNVSYSLESDNNVRPYALYNVSVFADGYFREKSVNVPVFAGITSVQQFNLVPLPLFMKESDETIEIFNQEPDL